MSEAAMREFLETDYSKLVAGLTLATGSRAAAEDAVNEAMARAWERMDRGRHIDSPPAWITTVAVNLSRSTLRRSRAERRAKDRLQAPSQTLEPSGERVDLERAVASLPRRQREAIILRYYLDLRLEDVAAAMGVSEGTAKSTLARARSKLAKELGEREEGLEHV